MLDLWTIKSRRCLLNTTALLVLGIVVFTSMSGADEAQEKPAAPNFKVEITSQAGDVLPSKDNFAFVGIEQTLIARVTPAVEGAEFEWTVDAPSLRTYEHDIQRADKHRPIALTKDDRTGRQFSFFWTKPQDNATLSVRVRKGGAPVTAKVTFHIGLPRDPNRDIYTIDDDPRRNPNGLSATYAPTKSHRNWHLGLNMTNGDPPVFAPEPASKLVWGDFGYRDDPGRLFGIDYNGSNFLRWHGAFLDAHRAWRQTFQIPDLDTAPPPGALPIPEYLRRVPAANSAAQSRHYGYVRIGEFQNLDEIGRDAVHSWHNRGHTAIALAGGEPRMDDHSVSPPARNDFFFRWHAKVEAMTMGYGPDKAAVTTVYPQEGRTVGEAAGVFIAFDKKVSANAPAVNRAQLAAGSLTVNGKPAKAVEDVGNDSLPFTMFRVTGFPHPDEGSVKVMLTGTPGYEGASWTFKLQTGSGSDDLRSAKKFRREAEKAFTAALARQRQEDIERVAALLKSADADDDWIGYLFQTYALTADEVVPLLVELLDHPSVHVKAHAVQMLQYRYASQAEVAIPKLIELLNGEAEQPWWLREWSARALGEIGSDRPEVIAALITCIQKKKPTELVNRGSIQALGRIGPPAREALSLLRKYVASADPATQFKAYRSVGQIVKAAPPSLNELAQLEVIDWKGPDGGYAVFREIQQAGPRAAFTVAALVETYRQNPPVAVEGMIIETLGKVEAGDVQAIQLLVNALPARWGKPGDPPDEKFLSDLARDALERLTPSDPEAVPVLAKALGHRSSLVSHQAALALQKFGPKAASAVPALVEALEQVDEKTSPHQIGAYLDALRAIGPNARTAGKTLVGLLSERSRLYRNREPFWAHYIQAWLVLTLADTDVPADAKPYILDFLNNSDKTELHGYAAAARAAGTLGPQMPEAIAGLLRSLKPDFPDVPMSFQYFGNALGAEDGSCRIEALRALAKMGPKAQEAVPFIARLVEERPEPSSVVPAWNEGARKALLAIHGKESAI